MKDDLSEIWVRSPIDPRAWLRWKDLTVEEAVAIHQKKLFREMWIRSPIDPRAWLQWKDLTVEEAVANQMKMFKGKDDRSDHMQQMRLERDNVLHGATI